MPTKNNYYDLPRPKREIKTFDFTDEMRPEVTESITLRYLNAVEQLMALEKATGLIEQHITNSEPWPNIGDEPPLLSESLLRQACSLEAMQPDGPMRINVSELVAMAHTCPSIYLQMVRAATDLNMGYDPKASAGATGGTSSGPASTAGQ